MIIMDEILETAKEYWISAGATALAHYRAAEAAARRNKQIGVPSSIVSAVVATSVFATLSDKTGNIWIFATGTVAVIAAVLASLQAYLGYGDRAEKHRMAGARYLGIRREIRLFEVEFSSANSKPDNKALQRLKKIAEDLNKLAIDTPTLASKIYEKAKVDFIASHCK